MTRVAILTRDAVLPDRSSLERALRSHHLDAHSLEAGLVELGGAKVRLSAVSGPVPNAEADTSAFLSLSAVNGRWRLAPHQAHLVLTLEGAMSAPAPGLLGRLSGATRAATSLERLTHFTKLAAAVTQATGGIGVHWSAGPVTHSPEFFAELARSSPLPLPLWLGVSLTPEPGGRQSVLSFGMQQLSLPDLLLTGPGGDELPDTIDFFFSALATVAEAGVAPRDGDSIPRSLLSRPRVSYGVSPVDGARVWKLDVS